MLDTRFAPMPKWNRQPALEHRQARFKTPYSCVLDKLESELRRLGARDVRIEAGYSFDQIRKDGWPRDGVRPAHPGVVLSFQSAAGSMCFPCGTYGRMEDNLHSIALTLESLRKLLASQEAYRRACALPNTSARSAASTR